MKAMKKKEYIAPETEMKTVELERGFMAASIYEKAENTEDLKINAQDVDETFDFRNETTWK